ERRPDRAVHRPAAPPRGSGEPPAPPDRHGTRVTAMADATAPIVELRSVTKQFFGVTAVHDFSLSLHAGQVVCLLGENGAGKSTIIKILTGVEKPTSGEVLVDGAPVHFVSPREARERGIATVYQEVGTLPLMSVARNFVLAAEPTSGKGIFRRL